MVLSKPLLSRFLPFPLRLPIRFLCLATPTDRPQAPMDTTAERRLRVEPPNSLALWAARWCLRLGRPPLWLTLATVLAGIGYAALSASWDLRREGSLLGLGEVRRNCAALAAAAARVAETVDGMEEDSELRLTFRARFPEH